MRPDDHGGADWGRHHASSRGDHRPPPRTPAATVAWNVGAASRSSFFGGGLRPSEQHLRSRRAVRAAQLRGAISLLRSPGRGPEGTRSPALVVDDADAPRAPSPTGSPGTLRPRRQGPPAKGEAAPVERRNDVRPWATGALPAALPRPPQLLRPPLRPRLRPTSTARRRQARRRARRRGPHRGRSRADRQLRPLRLTGARRIKRRPGSRSTSGARAYSWRAAARSLGMGRAS
jgi:hypothetical protein